MNGNGAVGASYGDLLVTSLLVLGAVCVAAFLAVRFFGRVLATGRSRGTHLMDVVARVPLEPRRSLYVVEVAGKTLLVGTSEMGLSVLSELDAAEVKSRVVPQQSFADLVRGAWKRRRGLASASAATTAPTSDVSIGVSAEPRTEAAPSELPRGQGGSTAGARDATAASSSDADGVSDATAASSSGAGGGSGATVVSTNGGGRMRDASDTSSTGTGGASGLR